MDLLYPVIEDRWRTDTVMAICRQMRLLQDYSGLPILADALQDAGCESESLLEYLRKTQTKAESSRLVSLVLGGEEAAATVSLDAFARKVGYSYDEVVNAGLNYVAKGSWYAYKGEDHKGGNDPSFDPDDMTGYDAAWAAQGEMYDEGVRDKYWNDFQKATGVMLPDDDPRESCFDCPC